MAVWYIGIKISAFLWNWKLENCQRWWVSMVTSRLSIQPLRFPLRACPEKPTFGPKTESEISGSRDLHFKMPNPEIPGKMQTDELLNTGINTRASLPGSCRSDLSPGCLKGKKKEQRFPLPQAAQNSCFLSYKQVISLGISNAEYCLLRSHDSWLMLLPGKLHKCKNTSRSKESDESGRTKPQSPSF